MTHSFFKKLVSKVLASQENDIVYVNRLGVTKTIRCHPLRSGKDYGDRFHIRTVDGEYKTVFWDDIKAVNGVVVG